jgi:hypothetical protein
MLLQPGTRDAASACYHYAVRGEYQMQTLPSVQAYICRSLRKSHEDSVLAGLSVGVRRPPHLDVMVSIILTSRVVLNMQICLQGRPVDGYGVVGKSGVKTNTTRFAVDHFACNVEVPSACMYAAQMDSGTALWWGADKTDGGRHRPMHQVHA